MDQIIETFIKDCKTRGLSSLTQKTYSYILKDFQEARKIDLKAVSRDDLKDYLSDLRNQGLSRNTIKTRFSAFATFYDYLVEEKVIDSNPVRGISRRYLYSYKRQKDRRKIISIEEASRLVNSILDSRDRAIVMFLFKTGLRRQELSDIDISDISLETNTIRLKATPKRSNRTVYFDNEAAEALEMWLRFRDQRNNKDSKALFFGIRGHRLSGTAIQEMVKKYAMRIGLHKNGQLEDRFTPHCCRHWFTTHLRKAGMPREFIQELRGDVGKEAIDIYDHIDLQELRESYLAYMPKLT
ncbi:MAG: tyrosine-type recombinase/integrase [Methanotrichaceae archaeon]|nr:tyrosine-type recombinase/integrase [Methanotrichaceae archaeon]